jgi:hypothetical protein
LCFANSNQYEELDAKSGQPGLGRQTAEDAKVRGERSVLIVLRRSLRVDSF